MQRLRDLGMPDWAMEYYRRAARIAGLAPHMVVCHLAVMAAGRQMQMNQPHIRMAETVLEGGEAPADHEDGTAAERAPSYESVQALRRSINGLWHDIQRHSALHGIADNDHAGRPGRHAAANAPAKVTRLRAGASARERTGARSRRR